MHVKKIRDCCWSFSARERRSFW